MKIADMPKAERPVSRLRAHGAETLSDAELVAVVTGTADLSLAREIVAEGISFHTIRRRANARQRTLLDAAFELTRRSVAMEASKSSEDPVRVPEVIARPLIQKYQHAIQEHLGIVLLDAKNRMIRDIEVYKGTLNTACVSTREMFKFALEWNAAALIMYHNHPSGDPAPSAEDLLFTRRCTEAGKVMGIEVLDHLILGANRFVSLKQRGAM